MKRSDLYVLAMGTRQPAWVNEGVQEYVRRLPPDMPLELVELKVEKRSAAVPATRLMLAEAKRLRAALPDHAIRVVLDEHGESWRTRDLADRIAEWRRDGRPVAFLIGGPDGIDAELKRESEYRFSLSRLTLPHGLARVLLVEQIYRAASMLAGHPYHRE